MDDRSLRREATNEAWDVAMNSLTARRAFVAIAIAGAAIPISIASLVPDAWQHNWKGTVAAIASNGLGAVAVPVCIYLWARSAGWRRLAEKLSRRVDALEGDTVGKHVARLLDAHVIVEGRTVCVADLFLALTERHSAWGLTDVGLYNVARKIAGLPGHPADHQLTELQRLDALLVSNDVLNALNGVDALRSTTINNERSHIPSESGLRLRDRLLTDTACEARLSTYLAGQQPMTHLAAAHDDAAKRAS